jgi:hypothetical protein
MQPYARQNVIVFFPLWVSLAAIAFAKTLRGFVRIARGEELQGVIIGFGILVFGAAIASGALGFVRLMNRRQVLWTEEDERMAAWLAANTPKKAAFVGCSGGHNPVSVLAGKVLYWHSQRAAWLAGFRVEERQAHIAQLLANPGNAELHRKIRYVVHWKDQCPEMRFNTSEPEGWGIAFKEGNYTVFRRNDL